VRGRLEIVSPVADRGDPGIKRLQGAPQGARVDILSGVLRPDAVQHRRVISGAGYLGSEPADGALPHVPVGVDEAGHHEATSGVDHLCVR
jgi:hypothetical protein